MTDFVQVADPAPARTLVLPIRLAIDPMQALTVASFKGDPEFEAFEPQVFAGGANGTGMRVLRYRKNGKVDVYWQPGVRVDRTTFTLGKGLADACETTIEPARMAITDRGLQLDVGFTDAQGRRVELQVSEDARGRRPFPLLAPVGADIERPTEFFLAYLPTIDLARRAATTFRARVGDRVLRPALLPILLGGRRVLFTRYAANPVIATINPPAHAPVTTSQLTIGGPSTVDGMTVVTDHRGRCVCLSSSDGEAAVEMRFDPAFPNLAGLRASDSVEGRWTLQLAGVVITGGTYDILRVGESVAIGLDCTDAWRPSGLPLMMRLFVRMARTFRAWPTTYRWRGRVELGPTPSMQGAWERVAPPPRGRKPA